MNVIAWSEQPENTHLHALLVAERDMDAVLRSIIRTHPDVTLTIHPQEPDVNQAVSE